MSRSVLSKMAMPPLTGLPQVGEIVKMVPSHSIGGTVCMHGSDWFHPHIYMGTNEDGDAMLVAVTHSHKSALGHSIPSSSLQHGCHLGGYILLKHVTAHPSEITRLAGDNIGAHDVATIRRAQRDNH